MLDPSLIKEIKRIVSITIMVNASVGHFIEAQILEAIGVDYIDDSEAIALQVLKLSSLSKKQAEEVHIH